MDPQGDGEQLRVRAVQGHSGALPGAAAGWRRRRSEIGAALTAQWLADDAAVPATHYLVPAVPLENPLHDPIRAPEEVPLALHATSPEKWVPLARPSDGVF